MKTSKKSIKPTPNEVRFQLLRKGLTLSKWGKLKGFHPRLVSRVVSRTGCNDYTPTGEKTVKIIIEISKTVGFAIHPIAEDLN